MDDWMNGPAPRIVLVDTSATAPPPFDAAALASVLNAVRSSPPATSAGRDGNRVRIVNGERFASFAARFLEGVFVIDDPFGGGPVASAESIVFESPNWNRVLVYAYRFVSRHEFFVLVTGQSECRLDGVLVPDLQLFLHANPWQDEAAVRRLVDAFRAHCSTHRVDLARRRGLPPGRPTAVIYNDHYAHHLWNELPALEHLARAGQPVDVIVATACLGPPQEVLGKPEGMNVVEVPREDVLPRLASGNAFAVPLGRCWIPASVGDGVMDFARRRYAAEDAHAAHLRHLHDCIVYVTMRHGDRNCLNQAELVSAVAQALAREYVNPLLITDGFSFAYGARPDPVVLARDQSVVAEIAAGSPGCPILDVSGNETLVSLLYAAAADAYLAHHGTLQHRAAWFSSRPGVAHAPGADAVRSNTSGNAGSELAVEPVYVYGEERIVPGRRGDRHDYRVDPDECVSALRALLPPPGRRGSNKAGGYTRLVGLPSSPAADRDIAATQRRVAAEAMREALLLAERHPASARAQAIALGLAADVVEKKLKQCPANLGPVGAALTSAHGLSVRPGSAVQLLDVPARLEDVHEGA